MAAGTLFMHCELHGPLACAESDNLSVHDVANAEEETKKFKMELVKAMEAADWDESSRAQLFSRLHFATEPVSSQPGWLPGVLQAWPSSQHVIRAESTGDHTGFTHCCSCCPKRAIPAAVFQHEVLKQIKLPRVHRVRNCTCAM